VIRSHPWRRLIGLLLAFLLVPTPVPAGGSGTALALSDDQSLVVEVWRLVNEGYVDPTLEGVPWRRARQKALERPIRNRSEAYDAIDAMLEPLHDPYTRLLRPDSYAPMQAATQGSVSGVGLELGLRPDTGALVVIAPLEGSPAAEAGLGDGTLLLSIDGVPTAGLGLEGSAARLRGEAGSPVHLEVEDPEGRRRSLDLERRAVDLRPVRSRRLRQDGHTLGYLRLTQFSDPVPAAVAEALAVLQEGGIEGLLLDLRNNSGGLVSAGLAVADDLLAGDVIVETQLRTGIDERLTASPNQLYDGPMLTLINGGTASASEILAGALQDAGRSLLAGQRSFGKAEIQSLIPLGDGSGLAVTTARYLTPSGRSIHGLGLEPDLPLPGDPPQGSAVGGDSDPWLRAAAEALVAQLPPGGS
jgi:carboxyl-terminal processing protease